MPAAAAWAAWITEERAAPEEVVARYRPFCLDSMAGFPAAH